MDGKELLSRIYERDREALFGNMHPEFICHTPGNSQIAGRFRGREGMLAHVQQMQALTSQTFRPRHQGVFVVEGDWGMVPVQLAGERGGRTLNQRAFGIWRFQDGLLIEHWESPTDMAAFDLFWGPAA